MVHAHDLMIGNWVQWNRYIDLAIGGRELDSIEFVQVRSVDAQGINLEIYADDSTQDIPLDEIYGIPISPNNLRRCGFKEDNRVYPARRVSDGKTIRLFGSRAIWVYFLDNRLNVVASASGAREHRHIVHMHQLQNLFYLLTGEHLQLNIPV